MLECLVNKITACGVDFKIQKGDNEWTSLVGLDKLKVLKYLPSKFSQCQPSDIHKLVENFDYLIIIYLIKSLFNKGFWEHLWKHQVCNTTK